MRRFEFYAATCMVGDLQFELIQPVYGDTMYQRFLDSGREGLHHIKEKITLADWEDTKSKFINQGMQVTSSGWLGTSFFGYFNTEPTLKFDFEVGNCPDKVEFPKECENTGFSGTNSHDMIFLMHVRQSKPPVKLVVCTSPKRAYYWRSALRRIE